MSTLSVHHLGRMNRDDMRAHTGDVLVLPLGSTEQHGPHLAMGTDTLLASRVAEAACDRVGSAGSDVVLAPSLPYGVSEHHIFAGAASVRPETYQRVVTDLLRSLTESGFSRFFVVNGHGGNHDSLGVVAKAAPLELGIDVAVCSYWNTVAGRLDDLEEDVEFPGHAGTFETSLVAAVDPALVDLSVAPTAAATTPPVWSRPVHPGVDVQLHDEWPRVDGYSDASAGASAALGERILARVVEEVASAMEAFAHVTDQRRTERGTP